MQGELTAEVRTDARYKTRIFSGLSLRIEVESAKRTDLMWERKMFSWMRSSVIVCLVLASHAVMAQDQNSSSNLSTTTSDQLLRPAEIEALVAPIALYPDNLLAVVLMASTYPLEVVQADRWATANKNLDQDQLKAAADKQPWDLREGIGCNSIRAFDDEHQA
jgi:hypothetical protein